MDEHVKCNAAITRLQAERQDLQIDLRNCRSLSEQRAEALNRLDADLQDAQIDLRNCRILSEQRADALARLDNTEQDRRRAWAQQILRNADDLDWDAGQIAAYVAGIASEVHDA